VLVVRKDPAKGEAAEIIEIDDVSLEDLGDAG
jgi:hypothetical protein